MLTNVQKYGLRISPQITNMMKKRKYNADVEKQTRGGPRITWINYMDLKYENCWMCLTQIKPDIHQNWNYEHTNLMILAIHVISLESVYGSRIIAQRQQP